MKLLTPLSFLWFDKYMLKHLKRTLRTYPRHFFAIILAIVFLLMFGLYLQYTSVTVYSGTLPCADCAGIKTTLTLNGNHTYVLSSLYIDRGNPYTEKGVWSVTQKNNMQVYQLTSGKQISYYQIVNVTTIKMLDSTAHPINAPFSLELKKE